MTSKTKAGPSGPQPEKQGVPTASDMRVRSKIRAGYYGSGTSQNLISKLSEALSLFMKFKNSKRNFRIKKSLWPWTLEACFCQRKKSSIQCQSQIFYKKIQSTLILSLRQNKAWDTWHQSRRRLGRGSDAKNVIQEYYGRMDVF